MMRTRAAFAESLRIVILLVAAALVLAMLLTATGHNPVDALAAMMRGAAGSWYQIVSVSLVRAVPLALTGLSVAIAFRAGILNIGAEGQLLVGASAAAALTAFMGTSLGVAGIPLLLAVGTLAGAAWAGVAAWLRVRFGVLEVISTIMLNFVAVHLVGYLVRGPLQEPLRIYPQSPAVPDVLQLPMLIPGTRLHVGALLAIGLAVLAWYWMRYRAGGFQVAAMGANERAARMVGRIAVDRLGAMVFVASGALAGIAGAIEYTGTTYALYENFSPGYGYTAIAVALLARLGPLAVSGTALLFGALDAGAGAMQRDAGVPNVVVSVVHAVLILLVLLSERLRVQRTLEHGT